MARKGLSEKEILELLYDSDFGADSDDNMDEPNNNIQLDNICTADQDDLIEIDVPIVPKPQYELLDMQICDIDDDEDEIMATNEAYIIATADNATEITLPETIYLENVHFTKKTDIEWRRREFEPTVAPFIEVPQTNKEILTPLTYFLKYIPNEIFNKYEFHTNQYAQQNNVSGYKPTDANEIKRLFGLHILMGCLKFPRLRLYWSPILNLEIFNKNMSCKRFCQLRQNLHVADNLDRPKNCTDKFYKTRPLIDAVRAHCLSINVEENICIDEQIIPFKGRLSIKQYMKGKPNPWGIKVYVLCGKTGIPYDFFIYQGANTGLPPANLNRFGFGASVILKLAERLQNQGHNLFFDNFFSSYNVFEILRSHGINAAGTVRINRFASPPIMPDKDIMKKQRGFCDSVTSRDGKVTLVKWRDNKPINLASNFVGVGSTDTAQRWDKSENKYISVNRPEIVQLYNRNMGGVDLLDQLISYYRVFIQSRKWPLRITTHFLDFAICSSWLEYKRDCESRNEPKKNVKDLLDFRLEVGNCLILAGSTVNIKKRGRPSSSMENVKIPTTKCKSETRPFEDVRFDDIGHMPAHDQKSEPTRCKLLNCKGRTFFLCKKCKVHLCINKVRNCFEEFHTKN